MSCQFCRPTRDSSVPIGSVLLINLVVVVVTTVGAVTFDAAGASPTPTRPTALPLGVSGGILPPTHEDDALLDVDSLVVRISMDGESLVHQSPVPFFSVSGFRPSPAGPFNTMVDPRWTTGETATLKLAGTNDPTIEPGATIVVHALDDNTSVVVLEAAVS